MSRFAPFLGIVAALVLGVLIVAFSGSVTVLRAPLSATATTSALSVLPDITLPSLTLPDLTPEKTAETAPGVTQSPSAPAKSAPNPSVSGVAPASQTVPVSAPTTVVPPVSASLDASASVLRSALVNIICYVPAGTILHSISGSGIIVDPKGIILTNAHIAQYFLLADRGSDCTIRSGSPASDKYEASLIYISPTWVKANATILSQTNPSGTGEYDFAFLAVTKSATRNELPSSFPYISLATVPPHTGTPVVIASYGAQFLGSDQILSSLYPTIVFGSVKDVFTFALNTIDVLALGGSAAAQEGSSGGGVAVASGELAGTITTSTVEGSTDTRSLDAITASYIRAEYASETGQALDLLLGQSPSTSVSNFAPQMSALESILTANL